jgi:UPF0755 protein
MDGASGSVILRRAALFPLLLLAIAAAAGYSAFTRWIDHPMAIGSTPVTIEVPRGQPFAATVEELSARGLLEHPAWLRLYARATGADARIKAGEYALKRGTTPRGLIALLESGDVVQHSVTLVEGWTFRDLRRALENEPLLDGTLAGEDDATVMAALGEPGQAPEGLFFPDTYLFGKGTTDLEILRESRARMNRELESAWNERAPDLPLASAYEALILASIVEKETALATERARIAGVFVTRLRRGMRLQTDPTVIYGLGPNFDGNLRRADLARDGPYNTYTRVGLPPTPIALPGAAALRAAVAPDERGELYFVATGLPDGSHEFSRTLAEHEAAVRRYLMRYRQQNAER